MTGETIEIKDPHDIVSVRQAGRSLARELGFGLADQTRFATAISELARNVIQYVGHGVCRIEDESDAHTFAVRAVMEDRGPGIPDVAKAMEPGFSTRRGSLGAGLPGARRLVTEFDIESRPGYTKVTIAIKRQKI